jgi:hypothetical protein
MNVKIIPITKHLCDRANQHGEIWTVITHDVSSGKVLVQSKNPTFTTRTGEKEHDLRWLNRGEFEIVD